MNPTTFEGDVQLMMIGKVPAAFLFYDVYIAPMFFFEQPCRGHADDDGGERRIRRAAAERSRRDASLGTLRLGAVMATY